MDKVLVIGANGKTGRHIIDQLIQDKRYEPVAMVRKSHQRDRFEEKGIQVRKGDLEENFQSVFEGIDKVIFAAGSGSSTGAEKTEEVDKEGAMKSIDYAKESGVKKYVMLSSMGTDIPDEVQGLKEYLHAKKEADDHLRNSGLLYTIVQPGGLTDAEAKGAVEVDFKLGKFGKVSREDVASVLVECLASDKVKNISFEMLEGEEPVSEAISRITKQ